MEINKKIELVQSLIDMAKELPHRDGKKLDALLRRAEMIIRNVFGDSSKYLEDLDRIDFYPMFSPANEHNYEESWISSKNEILNLFNTILEKLKILSEHQTVDVSLMKVTREGVFFAGQYFDAMQHVRDIFSQAHQTIVIIDAYINQDVLNLLTPKDPSVEVSILTKEVPPVLKTAALAFNKQYGQLSIRASQAFHDRFIIVDDRGFYHFGASIKDIGHRGFMFSRIEEPKVIKALQTKWTEEWTKAKIIV